MSAGLPAAVAREVEQGLEELGRPARIVRSDPLSGGCINPSARLTTDRGEHFFLKWNARAPAGMFGAEARGLAALAATRALRVPEVRGVGAQWLLLEHVEGGRPARDYAERLGRGLAALHRGDAAAPWGWEQDNFIGRLAQTNQPARTWGEFWRDRRLGTQLALARSTGHLSGKEGRVLDEVVERCPVLLADVGGPPSLLHGDLWGGNVFADEHGQPVIIDPAVYRGHHEADLAMSELFGGFPAGWPGAYADAWPIDPGYARYRRALYQLYYLLVHVNLFGAGYESGCVRAAKEALRG